MESELDAALGHLSTIVPLSNVSFAIDPMGKEPTSDIPRIEDGLPGPLDEKHDSPWTVICIKQSDPDMLFRGEFNLGGCI